MRFLIICNPANKLKAWRSNRFCFVCSGPCQDFGAALFQGPGGENLTPTSPAVPVLSCDLVPGADFASPCSLLQKYPDLQMTGSEQTPPSPLREPGPGGGQPDRSAQLQPQDSPASLVPDQGYLAMGASMNISLDLPGEEPGPEPMTNSLLNGLLDKQLDEVYMLLLNDNLARCNSHLGDSLLHGLVPPPQPSCRPQGTHLSLDPSLGGPAGEGGSTEVSYLSTHNPVPCSSHFSTPVLRISEVENTHLK